MPVSVRRGAIHVPRGLPESQQDQPGDDISLDLGQQHARQARLQESLPRVRIVCQRADQEPVTLPSLGVHFVKKRDVLGRTGTNGDASALRQPDVVARLAFHGQ